MAGGEIMENNNDFELDYLAIGKRIAWIRDKLEKTQGDFAAFVFPDQIKDQSYISKWENGGRISLDDLAAIARAGNVSLDWLATGNSFKPAGIENNRFTLREICAALSQAIFLCGASINTIKNENGDPVILISFPVYQLESQKIEDIAQNTAFEKIADFLAAFSSVVSLDISHNAFAHTSHDIETILERGGTIGLHISKLEGVPNTAPARQILDDYLQTVPNLTPYAYSYSVSDYSSVNKGIYPRFPNSLHEHIEFGKKYNDEQ